jgi:hypothetical protein
VTAADLDLRGACVIYTRAACNRRAICAGASFGNGCDSVEDLCPDYLFSDGSLRTIEHTLACAEEYRTFDCDALARGVSPDCTIGGTRPAGAACTFGSQCDSNECTGNGRECGICLGLVGPGADCAGTVSCEGGYDCLEGVCAPAEPNPEWMPPVTVAAGLACDWGSTIEACEAGSRCVETDQGYVCQPLPLLGEACTQPEYSIIPNYLCADGAYCASDFLCLAEPPIGAPCGIGYSGGEPRLCALHGAFCEPETLTCQPSRQLGESCTSPADTYIQRTGPYCEMGLWCACTDPDCTTGECVEPRFEGERCGEPTARCEPDTECRNGICAVPGDGNALQGLADGCE